MGWIQQRQRGERVQLTGRIRPGSDDAESLCRIRKIVDDIECRHLTLGRHESQREHVRAQQDLLGILSRQGIRKRAAREISRAYDRAAHVATVTVRLENMSEQTLRGPFKLRVIELDSQMAAVAAVGASNGKTGPGAVWDLTSAVEGAELAPGESSQPVTLSFELDDIRSLLQGSTDQFDAGAGRAARFRR